MYISKTHKSFFQIPANNCLHYISIFRIQDTDILYMILEFGIEVYIES